MKRAAFFSTVFLLAAVACGQPPAPPTPTAVAEPFTPTPEVFIARTQAIPAQVQLNGVTLAVQAARLGECDLLDCPPAPAGTRYLRVTLQAMDLPAGQSLDYKNLPQGIAIHDNTGASTPFDRLYAYMPAAQQLTLYFAVPAAAEAFGLQWPAVAEIPLTVAFTESPATPPLPSFEGVAVTFGKLSLVLPPGLANGVRGSEFARVDGEDAAWWQKTPGHIQLGLEGYLLQDKSHPPQFYVYPAQAYAELVPAAFESLRRLDNLLYGPSAPISVEQLPAAPFSNDLQAFAAHIQVIAFQNGGGVRFLTQSAQYAAPANNRELFYHFEGMTRDGAYYVVAILPITAPVLAETSDGEAALPPGGVPYPDITDPNANWPGYYSAVTALLDATSPETFAPTTNQLDLLIQSMKVTP